LKNRNRNSLKIIYSVTLYSRPGKKPANTGVVLTNEENLNSGSEDHFIKIGTANLAGEDKRKKVCGTHFVK
jgi:hypothetical protein